MRSIFAKCAATVAASTVLTGAIAAFSVSPAHAASFQYVPGGTQLDNDSILDIETNVGEQLTFDEVIDTTGLPANLNFLQVLLERDNNELPLAGFVETAPDVFRLTLSDQTIDPNTGVLQVFLNYTAVGSGLAPNSNRGVTTVTYDTPALINDGVADIDLRVTSALDATGRDVTSLFQPASQSLEVQEVPEPSSILGVLAATGAGFALKKRLAKSRKSAS